MLVVLVATVGCKKDDDFAPFDYSDFYRMKNLDVDVVPQNRMVQVLFQVTDYFHKGVTTLKQEDFIVTENGGKLDSEADLRVGRGSIPYELKTILLLDISRSIEGFVPQIKDAAKAMVDKKLPDQQIAIYTFDAQTVKLQGFTEDKQALIAAINSIPESGLFNSTNLYGAIIEMAGLWDDSFDIDEIVDGSLIVFTDGRHNASQTVTLQHVKNALGSRRVYIAALASPDLDEPSLKLLANDKDRYFRADDVAGLEKMFLDIQTEIQTRANSIYFLYYQSPISDPTPFNNELKIEIRDNINPANDGRLITIFNSAGFGG